MRNIQKRTLSLLVVIALCLSFIVPAVQTPAAAAVVDVDYKYSNGTTGYIYNWGNRDEVATFLSPMAGEFYTDNNTYEVWSQLDGGTSTSDAPSSALYNALGKFMKDNHSNPTSYDGTRDLYKYTDCENNGTPSTISSFYSGKAIGPAWDSGNTWNREHTWPKSKSNSESNGSTGRNTDIMMLRPTATSENGSRGNKAYGENVGTDIYDPNELGQKVRGDVARIVLYVYTRWGYDTEKHDGAQKFMWGSNGVIESKDILLKWMAEDPVDTWEMGRNDAVQSITGTRNVFVDYPQLAFQLFGQPVPADMKTPNGEAAPQPGETVTVTYKQNGVTVSTASAYENGSVTLPAHSGTAPTGYTFVGWVTAAIDGSVSAAPAFTAAGAKYTVTGDTTFHALYTTGSGSSASGYVKVTAAPSDWSGTYLIVYGDGKVAFNGGLSKLDAVGNTVAVTISDGVIEATDALESAQFIIAKSGSAYTVKSASGYYIGQTSNANGLGSSTSSSNYSNKITFKSADEIDLVSGGAYLRFNSASDQNRFRYYKSSTYSKQKAIQLYKLSEGSGAAAEYVTTTCAHTTYTAVAANAATCTEPGNTAGKLCGTCGAYFGGYEVISATGHSWDEGVVTEPTATEKGYTTYTCTNANCGETKVENYKDALGQPYTVTFVVPEGVAAIESKVIYAAKGGTLPTAEAPAGEVEYTFIGWSVQTYDNVTTAPTVLTGKYYPTADVTLNAVYRYSVGGTGAGDYELTDLANISASDNVVITATKDGVTYALPSTNLASSAPAATAVTVSGNKLSATPADGLIWNIANASGTLTISTMADAANKLYCTNANNGVRVGSNANNTFVVDETSGYLKNTATERYLGVYFNADSGAAQDWRCYQINQSNPVIKEHSNIGGQTLGFYVQQSSGTAYFTTVIGDVPENPDPEQPPVTPDPTPDIPAVDYNTQLSRLPADGEYIVIVNSGKAMSKNASGKKLAAVTATVTDNVLTVTNDMACLKVVVEGDKYIFMLGDKYLTSGATGNGLSYADNLSDLSRWTMESAGNGAWYITNVGANYNGNYNQAMEYYSGFTTYGIKQQAAWQMQLFLVEAPEEGDEPETPVVPAEPKPVTIPEAVEIGSAMTSGTYTSDKYIVTGKILQVYGETYGNMYIQDEQGNILTIYGSYNADGSARYDAMTEKPDAGDTVTLLGALGNYSGKAQMKDGWIQSFTAGDAPNFTITAPENAETATITFDDVAKQTISDAKDQIVWTENGIVVTADKAESSTDANGAISPARFYKDYVLTVDGENMKMIEFNCGDIFYAQDLVKSIEALNDSNIESIQTALNVVAVTFVEPVETFQFTLLKQVRAYNFTIYATTDSEPENLPTASDIFFAIDFGSSMTVNALIPMEVLDSFDSYSVKLSAEGREPVVLTSGGNYLDTYYEFAYANLTVLDVAKTVNVELTVTKGGQSYTTTDQKSILSFCETAIANNTSDAEPCAFLLQYAKAAAAYKEVEGVELSAAAQSIIDGSSLKDALPGEAIRERENGQQISFLGQSLDMTARIAINFHINLYNYAGDVNALTFDVNGKAYRFEDLEDDGDGIYILSYSDFDATEMSEPAKCTVKVDGQVEAWYETSVERYCRGTLNNTENEATMIELAKCIYRYGAACANTYGN